MSIVSRLWRIGKAYLQSHPKKFEEELKQWEEEIEKEKGRKKNPSGMGYQKDPRIEDIADAFRALEVKIGADFETCHRAYRNLARKYHPDQWQDQEKQEIAKKLFQLIGDAFIRIKKFYKKK